MLECEAFQIFFPLSLISELWKCCLFFLYFLLFLAKSRRRCGKISCSIRTAFREFRGEKKGGKTLLRGGAHGGCLQDLGICENTLAEGGGRKNMTWICVWVCTIYYIKLRSSRDRPWRVLPPFAGTCSSSSSVPITSSRPTPVSKPPPSSRLRVFLFVSFVMSI